MTWPLAAGIGHLGRTQNTGDGRFSVWNIAWVAHALSTDPVDLFDANIFYPHRRTLAFSESNIGAGLLAVPVWVATRNPFATHNVVLLLAFATSVAGAWLLARRLTGDARRRGHGGGALRVLPLRLLSHRAHPAADVRRHPDLPAALPQARRRADASPRRGSWSRAGGAGTLVRLLRHLGRLDDRLRRALLRVVAADVERHAILDRHCRRRGRSRSSSCCHSSLPYLDDPARDAASRARCRTPPRWSAFLRSYLVSGAHAHRWMLALIGNANQAVLFPGFLSLALGSFGLMTAWRRDAAAAGSARFSARSRNPRSSTDRSRSLTLWASLGPRAGLYTLLYRTIPVFSFLRAPERMGIVVASVSRSLRRLPSVSCAAAIPAQASAIAVVACAAAHARAELRAVRLAAGQHSAALPRAGARAARTGRRVPVLRPPLRLPHPHALHAELDRALAAAPERLQRLTSRQTSGRWRRRSRHFPRARASTR